MQKQRGFIQNFIIPGIILIGVVIAGIAMLASNSGGTDTSNEKAAMLANTVIGNGLTLSGAIQRAQADGGIATSGVHITNQKGGTSFAEALVTPKYLTSLPTAPQGLASLDLYFDSADAVIVGVGTTEADDILRISIGGDAMGEAVCKRINNKVNGVSSTSAVPVTYEDMPNAWTEGCVGETGAAFNYFKVVNAK